MNFLEKRYIDYISMYLEKFRWVRDKLAVCRCPICGDSKKSKQKRRFYFYVNKNIDNRFFVHCKNCGYSSSFIKFLQNNYNILYNEYISEKYKSNNFIVKEVEQKFIKEEKESIFLLDNCVPISKLPINHYCHKYIISRKIPEEFYDKLWFTKNFKESIKSFNIDLKNIPEDDRLIIPFFDQYQRLIMVQGRTLSDSKLRYISINPNSYEKIYGLDRVDKTKLVYVVEGPLDSLFIPNCVATADSDLSKCVFGDIFLFDNEYRNKEICHNIQKVIKKGRSVVLFDKFPYKDINEAIMNGLSKEELLNIVQNRTFIGLKAQLEFSRLKKA